LSRATYWALHRFTTARRFLRERLTHAGWLVLGAAAIAAAVGLDTSRSMTFQAFTFLVALLGLAVAVAALVHARVVAVRVLPRYATVGEVVEYRVSVTNRGSEAMTGMGLVEHVSDARPGYEEWRTAREPDEARRNWFDRRAGYFRWQWLIERRRPRLGSEVTLPPLAPGGAAEVKLCLTPCRRGRVEFAGLTLTRTDPLGLVKGLVRVAAPATVTALPKRYRLPRFALPGTRRFQQGGITLATSVGDSQEFVGLREYRPGDPLQKVHWKSFARTGKPIVKEFQDEFFERHALLLDTSTDRGEDAVFEEGVSIAASFVLAIDTQECLLDLLFVGSEVHTYTAGRGQMRAEHLLEILAGLAPSAPERFDLLANAVRASSHRLTSCIAVLLTWDEVRREFIEGLRRSGHEVRVLLVCPEGEAPVDLPRDLLVLRPGAIEQGLARLQ
jgi:uncharacterized protein (DUF58 family)